jgi:IK cytokine
MLTNTDFVSLLKDSSTNGLSNDKKIRFDLKQVKAFDKQNDASGKRKPKKKDFSGKGESKEEKDSYRDRANERRKDVVTSEEANLATMVSNLDAEQTKFLGGDVEHTHLVKGLDYALLRKIREQEKDLDGIDDDVKTDYSDKKVAGKDAFRDFRAVTSMGTSLKNLLLVNKGMPTILKVKQKGGVSSSIAEMFSRTAFEFDLNDENDTDLPTTISRSKEDWANDIEDNKVLLSCILSNNLNKKLALIFSKNINVNIHTERQLLKRKRKENIAEQEEKKSMALRQIPKGIIFVCVCVCIYVYSRCHLNSGSPTSKDRLFIYTYRCRTRYLCRCW